MTFFEKEVLEVRKWLERWSGNCSRTADYAARLEELLAGTVELDNVTILASQLRGCCVLWDNRFLDSLGRGSTSEVEKNGAWVVDARNLHLNIIIGAIEHPAGRGRVFTKDLYLTFLLSLSLDRWDQADWLGRKIFEGDKVETFNTHQDEGRLVETSEWEALGGDISGLGSVIAAIRRFFPGQRKREASAGNTDHDPAFPFWEDSALCGLVTRLWCVMNERTVPAGLPACGVYSGFFQYWDDEERLSQSMVDACDYHLTRVEENSASDEGLLEFDSRPYNVLPVEILALRAVRRRFGLQTPWPDHPLLGSAFVKNLPAELPPNEDELIRRVCDAAKSVLPNIG